MTNQPAEDEPGAAPTQEPADATEPTDATEPAQVAEPAAVAEPADAAEPVAVAEPADAAEPVDITEPIDSIESAAEPVDTVEPTAAFESAAPPPPPPPSMSGTGFPPPSGGAGFPPPGGFPPPPPGTGGWATRYGLVRPAQGRMFAGVCAAIGRATNTDPVLWRVLLAVFTLAGGVGLLLYLVGWLFIPDEGDTASPAEALVGRGRSRTNPILVVVIAIIAAIGLGSVFRHSLPSAIIPFVLIVVAIVLVTRRDGGNRMYGQEPPSQVGNPVPPSAATYVPPSPGPGPSGYTPPVPQPGAYRPPFAPHGPYATTTPYPGLVQQPVPQPPPYVPRPPVSVPPKPPAPRSRLGLVTLSLTLLSVGTLAIIGLASGGVPAAAYFAAALAAVGVGLLMGAWVGRARWLIFPGILLSLALAVSSVAPRFGPIEAGGGDIRWSPTSFAEISDRYTHGAGTLELDLSQVDFTGHTKVITVHLNLGDARIMLPSKVDATVNAKVDTGDVRIFEDRWSGVNNAEHTITDNGTDGPGGGRLVINIKVNLGSVEVNR